MALELEAYQATVQSLRRISKNAFPVSLSQLDDSKVLSEYGFGPGGSTELVVAFGKMDEEKAARVKDKIGGGQGEFFRFKSKETK